MRVPRLVFLAAVLAALVTTATAGATMHPMRGMHPRLAAKLAGMGQHGVVNLRSQVAKARLCWTFELPAMTVTGASIRDAHGMKVLGLGMHYKARACEQAAKRTLRLLEAHPARYRVWVDTKGHPGDLRGKLFVGMAHLGHM
jgi:hypothetical protein